jgi:hypothetical protein
MLMIWLALSLPAEACELPPELVELLEEEPLLLTFELVVELADGFEVAELSVGLLLVLAVAVELADAPGLLVMF